MKRKRRNKQRKLLIIASISFLFIMTAGYAAFQTNLNITAKGNIKKSLTAADQLIETEVTTGDGLYKDEYEDGRYVYKGANPNHYITFNNELWRIIAVEKDGTLKIIKKDSIGNMAWDTANSDDWTKPATLNTYLNTEYYNSLSSEAQDLIYKNHTWGIGPATYNNTDLAGQIQSENSTTWNGNIGLMSVSDYIRANTNTEQCGNFSLRFSNYKTCQTTDYIISSWLINTDTIYDGVYNIGQGTDITAYHTYFDGNSVVPVLYLKSEIHLDGEGTESNPYTIILSN